MNFNVFKSYLDELYPDAKCELYYDSIFHLLIAVMLSAQTTDKAVNLITPILFNKYKDVDDLANANLSELENDIKAIGLYKNKARNLILCANKIKNDYNGNVPNNMEDLVLLPGVGRKTASVVLVEGFKIPAFPVDTHIDRVSKRLGFANNNDNVYKIEINLRKLTDPTNYHKLHHQMIFFGRYFCKAINPSCNKCKLTPYCKFYKSKTKSTAIK